MQDAARTFCSRKEGLAEKMMAWEAAWPNLGVEVSDRGMEQKRESPVGPHQRRQQLSTQ